jgi:Adenosine deaminase
MAVTSVGRWPPGAAAGTEPRSLSAWPRGAAGQCAAVGPGSPRDRGTAAWPPPSSPGQSTGDDAYMTGVPPSAPGLCDLHVHFSGSIRPPDYLRFLAAKTPRFETYEKAMETAYGDRPRLHDLLPHCLAGDEGALAEFARLFTFADEDGGSFSRFRAKLTMFHCTSVLAEPRPGAGEVLHGLREEARFFASAISADRQREGVTCSETRLLLGSDMTHEMAEAVLGELLASYQATAGTLTQHLIPTLPRADPFPSWDLVRRWVLGPRGNLITGIDFCGREEGHPPREQAGFFQAVRDFNELHPARALAILYHVGEVFEDKSLESAVRWVDEAAELGAHRLGHALALVVEPLSLGCTRRREAASERRDQIRYDLLHAEEMRRMGIEVDAAALGAELAALDRVPAGHVLRHTYDERRLAQVRLRQDFAMKRIRSAGPVIEICPTCNRRMIGVPDVTSAGVRRLHASGIPFVVGTDNPGLLGVTLAQEMEYAAKVGAAVGCGIEELRSSAWNRRSEVISGRRAAHAQAQARGS